jgi:hypothetical protein
VRQITSNVSGRLTLSGRLRHRSRSLNVWLRRATLIVVAGKTRSGSLTVSAPKRRIINRRLRSGRLEVDVTARLAGVRTTARTRIRGK